MPIVGRNQPSAATTATGSALPPIQMSSLIFDSPSTSPHLPSLSLPQTSPDPSTIIQNPSITATAQQIAGEAVQAALSLSQPGRPLEPELPTAPPQDAGLSDKFFHPQGLGPRPSSTWPMMQGAQAGASEITFYDNGVAGRDGAGVEVSSGGVVTNDGMVMRAATFPRPIAMNPDARQRGDYTSEFNAGSRAMRPKVRGRFTASRRKEVQEVRKRGACIRCRMLKKPVSGLCLF